MVLSDRTGGNERKMKHKMLLLDIMLHINGVIKRCHRLPREMLESPSSDIFISHMDMVLGSWL